VNLEKISSDDFKKSHTDKLFLGDGTDFKAKKLGVQSHANDPTEGTKSLNPHSLLIERKGILLSRRGGRGIGKWDPQVHLGERGAKH